MSVDVLQSGDWTATADSKGRYYTIKHKEGDITLDIWVNIETVGPVMQDAAYLLALLGEIRKRLLGLKGD